MSNTAWLLWAIGAVLAVYAGWKLDQRAENERQAQLWREEFNERTGIHPADDFSADWDSWPMLERWQRNNPEKAENYLRDAMAHREVRK